MSKTNCVNIKENEESCTCTSTTCDKHGICCECLRAHLAKDSFPSCVRAKMQNSQELRDYTTNLIEQLKT